MDVLLPYPGVRPAVGEFNVSQMTSYLCAAAATAVNVSFAGAGWANASYLI